MTRSRIFVLAAALVLLLLPGVARGAPAQIAPAEFQARLQRAISHLEAAQTVGGTDTERGRNELAAARAELGSEWQVDGLTVDMRPVLEQLAKANPRDSRSLPKVIEVLREHVRSLDAAQQNTFKPMPDAREKLDDALANADANRRGLQAVLDWISRMWRRLFGESRQEAAAPPGSPSANRGSYWAALLIGVAGVGLLAWGVARSLRGHGGAAETAVRLRRAGRPDRPATPDELWQQAGLEAEAGEYKEALRLAHLAMLQHLDRTGLLRFMPYGTNREHESMLRRRHPELARTMHQLNDLVESRLYSGQSATAADFEKGQSLARQLWREGDAVSKSAQEPNGASSSASSS